MKTLRILAVALLMVQLTTVENQLNAQTKKTISIKKGQAFDLLVGTRKPGTDELLNTYFSKVFPLAGQHSYTVLGSFPSVAPPTKGNLHPGFVSLGSWNSAKDRDNFREASKSLDFDYVSARREIWSVFTLTEYNNLEEDITFEVNTNKVYVYTAYWVKDLHAFRAAKAGAAKKMTNAGGKLLMRLGKGESPNGYFFEPDIISLTEWDSEEAFRKYNESIDFKKNDAGTRNVNQWITRFLGQ